MWASALMMLTCLILMLSVILASLWLMMIKHNILVQVCQLYQILIVVISLKLPSFLILLFIIYCYFSYFLAIDLFKWVFAFSTLMEPVLLCLCQSVLVLLWVPRCVFVFRKEERLIISLLNRPCLPPGVVSKRSADGNGFQRHGAPNGMQWPCLRLQPGTRPPLASPRLLS